MEMIRAQFYSPTVKYGGTCPICHRFVNPARHWEVSLYSYEIDGERHYLPVHDECARVKKRSKVGGGVKVENAPDIEVSV